MKKFETFEHTADIGLKIYAKDLKGIFTNAAAGLLSLITDLKKVSAKKNLKVSLKDEDREELLVSWLNELIFQFSAHNFLDKQFKINKISDNSISADIRGEKIDLSKHKILVEIKAATYHELEIKKTKGGFQARVILDT
jgi:SHS2 domain-containing protein